MTLERLAAWVVLSLLGWATIEGVVRLGWWLMKARKTDEV